MQRFARSVRVCAVLALAACAPVSRELVAPDTALLQQQADRLQVRVTRLQDVNAIKRLQRAYGYYLSKGMWDEVANLFAADGSIEIGLDGVYSGRQRVREYLQALGKGRSGLSPGQLNEHLQLMPVVTLDAQGTGARGTWRALLLVGELGRQALWGEGPYENSYVKQDGVWKIRSVHWYQTLLVPYDGGWAKHADSNGARFVRTLTPDAPPTVQYASWPKALLPPFHFKQPVDAPVTQLADPGVNVATRLAAIARSVPLLEDQEAIERLQRIYGFYIDKGQWDAAASLFTDDARFEVAGVGSYRGQSHILEYLRGIGPAGPEPGRLYDNMQLQPIVDVAPDGRNARGRWQLFFQRAIAGRFHEWGTGIYENEYEKQHGVWKISALRLYPTMITPYEQGWGKTALARSQLESTATPDRPWSGSWQDYRGTFVVPFHYAHPVAGRASALLPGGTARPLRGSETDRRALLAQLESRVRRLEDIAQIENLQMIYGYYLATLDWDRLTELFAEDGSIEIAQRGVYVGKASVRRSLNLYGQQGLDDNVLHNHMQYQCVIDVSADGTTAKLRSRAFSMMGEFGKSGTWMGGLYENELVKIDGVWKFRRDQQINTYFAPYDVGWKNLAQRLPPQRSTSNPPDRAPSLPFDMYPKNYLPRFHYANPVTGAPP